MLAYRVQEHNKTSQTIKKKRNKGKKKKKKKRIKVKQIKTSDRCSEECDAKRSERKGKAAIARGTPYVLKRNRYLLHGQNNKKIAAVLRGKKHTKKRKIRRYGHMAVGEGNKGANKTKGKEN